MPESKRRWRWRSPVTQGFAPEKSSDPFRGETDRDPLDAPRGPSRWVDTSDEEPVYDGKQIVSNLSPYGFADDDASMRQVEGEIWRRPVGLGSTASSHETASRRTRFVARADSSRSSAPRIQKSSPSSHFLWQLFLSAVLVGTGFFVTRDSKVPSSIDTKAQSVFETDYTAAVQPALNSMFTKFHIAAPAFTVANASLHAPMRGTIVDDYGANHPEIWLAGQANQIVQSAGSGTVITVTKSAGSELVRVDGGASGTAIYDGLGTVSVKVDEYVNSGESIGRLPKSPTHPILRFALVQHGKYVNPHDFIQFSGSSL